MNLQSSFKEFCLKNKLEINKKQINIIKSFENFIKPKKLINYFSKIEKKCFYLYGNVGVGKTMIAKYVFNQLEIKKMKVHFNEFMVNFHDFRHNKKDDNTINQFVKNLKKKAEFIYLDEFQVTNIVDAMILGKLFEIIFRENIQILVTTNTKPSDLYKDGLQREQFVPFISLIEKNCTLKELSLEDDYRKQINHNNQKVYYPLNEKTLFNMNQNFRIFTKNLKKEEKFIKTKGRLFKFKNYYNGVARFNFKDLCDKNLGAEDYLNISKICKYIFIDEVPVFDNINSNQQLRFITLIDILYEKKISLIISAEAELKKLGSSIKHAETFKRTISRLHEMTAAKNSSI